MIAATGFSGMLLSPFGLWVWGYNSPYQLHPERKPICKYKNKRHKSRRRKEN
jgi:hypothetical protein